MRRIGTLVVGFALILTWQGRAQEAKKEKEDLAAKEKRLSELVNAERKKEGLGTLRWNAVMAKVARAHAENMAKHKKEEHKLDGKDPYDRLRAAGYRYYRAGENLGSVPEGYDLPDLVKAWLGSKGHRDAMMHKDYEETGIGAAVDADGRIYFAQVFGKPKK